MKTLSVDLENCYGIKKIDYQFDFNESNIYSIYAANGVMKSSFAKTFHQLQNGNEPSDRMFTNRQSICNVTYDDGKIIKGENIFVIHSYDEEFKSSRLDTLLLKESYKDDYKNEISKIIEFENIFLDKILRKTGLGNIETLKSELLDVFNEKKLYDIICNQEEYVKNGESIYGDILYNGIFNKKSYDFLLKNQGLIKDYINSYNKLLESSQYLGKKFNHYKAKKLGDSLGKMNFFKGLHKISLFNSKTNNYDSEIINHDDYQSAIKKEETHLYQSPELNDKIQKIDKAIKNAELELLRDYLFENKEILTQLGNVNLFRKELLRDYFIEYKYEFDGYLEAIKEGQKNIEEIFLKAEGDMMLWKESINEFNNRFINMPFKLNIKNLRDMITDNHEPHIIFSFKDIYTGEISNDKDEKEIISVLSGGEKRALYLLNIIFEIKARVNNNQKTLFIVDDIADSFDYKNKYAIVEYLNDIMNNSHFYLMIFTHNFDFFRTINNRLSIKKGSCSVGSESKRLQAFRLDDRIELRSFRYDIDPFKEWKDNLNVKNIIALIPFVRNLIEYGLNEQNDFLTLTHILHKKENLTYTVDGKYKKSSDYDPDLGDIIIPKTESLKFSNIEPIFIKYLGISCLNLSTEGIIDTIYNIVNNDIKDTSLENKIILAIAIRLKAEDYMINLIANQNFVNKITASQTGKLIKKIKKLKIGGSLPNIENTTIRLLDSVNIMTPENIHVNSFMYEPILDMDICELKSLYGKISDL